MELMAGLVFCCSCCCLFFYLQSLSVEEKEEGKKKTTLKIIFVKHQKAISFIVITNVFF